MISISRRAFAQLALVLPWLSRQTPERRVETTADGEPRFVAPPGEPSAERKKRIELLRDDLEHARITTCAVLADPASNELRPFPAFRALIASHAPTGRVVLTPKDEPGVPLLATVSVVDREQRPYAGARVYAYQTSAKGWYAAEAPHVAGDSGDHRFARLFTYGVTDANGRCELVTIHPTGYPHSDLPSHIHVVLDGREGDQRVTEIRFEDCPRMSASARAESLRSGFVVVPVEKLADGGARCTAVFSLPAG